MTDLLAALATEADVTAVDADAVTVRTADGAARSCRVLQTSGGPPLALAVGDRVLVATAGEAGYILGRLGPHRDVPETARVVEIVVPEGVETVRIAGRRVTIAADESVAIECGGGSVRIDKRGKVVVLGTDITSRAKRLHKVKGASVAIN